MLPRKTFYPAKDVVLHGVPGWKDVTLRGILEQADIVLCGISDVFPYREYATLSGAIILQAHEMLIDAIKEIELAGGITLDSSEVEAQRALGLGELSAEVVLGAILVASMRKVVEAAGMLHLGGTSRLSRGVSAELAPVSLALDGDITRSFVYSDVGAMAAGMLLDGEVSTAKLLALLPSPLMLGLQGAVRTAVHVPAVVGEVAVAMDGAMTAVIKRYRTFGDVDGMTFDDVREWTMETFYYLEV